HVTEIYDHLSPADQQRARQIFLTLVDISGQQDNPDGSSKAVSRRAYLSQFTEPETRRVLLHLIDANLLVSDGVMDSGVVDSGVAGDRPRETKVERQSPHHATVELAHETLIRSWPQLQTWLEENQEIINLKHRLSDEARRWQEVSQTNNQQATDELWRGSKLERVVELRQDGVFDSLFGGLEATEIEFIDVGVKERDRQHHEREQQRQRELRLYRAIAIGAGVALAIISSLGIIATISSRTAQRREIEALITAADAKFVENRHSLDTLVAALEAGDRLQNSFWFRGNTELHAEALQVVSQAVYWVREQGTLSGHSQFVEGVAVSPDQAPEDQLIATAGRDGTIRLWTSQGKQIDTLMEQERPFSVVQFSPDGETLAIADYDGKVTLWSRQDGSTQPLGNEQNGHQDAVRAVRFHPTEPRIATSSNDGTVKIWDTNGQLIRTLDRHQAEVYAATYSPDGQFLVTGGADQTVIIWDQQGEPVYTLENINSTVLGLDFSQGGKWLVLGEWLAIALNNGTVEIRQFNPDIPTLSSPETTLRGHTAGVTAVQFSPNGTLIVTASVDGTAKIWNRFGRELYTLKGHDGRLNSLAFNATGAWLITISNDSTAKIWTLDSPNQQILTGHSSDVYSVDFSDSDQLLATAGSDDKILLWDTTMLSEIDPKVLQADTNIYSVVISPENRYVAAALGNGSINIWPVNIDGNDNTLPLLISAHGEKRVSDIQFSNNSETLISVGFDSAIQFWRIKDGNFDNIQTIIDQSWEGIYTVSLNQANSMLAIANNNRTVSLWQLATQEVITIEAHEESVYQVLFTPDGQNLVTASEDKIIKLWNLDGQLQQKFRGHNSSIWGLDISSDGQLIASGSDDRRAIIWAIGGEKVLSLEGHQEDVNTVSFSHDCHWLATGSADDTVILWNIENLSLSSFMQKGCNWATHHQSGFDPNLEQRIYDLCLR
ncbi:MAG: WD40 repeat domain-containing protein, partial [Leptolyngbyaceae bacterium]|nr:WD40 repeat domain-containing protein [Leptolyngbyaceae bacterium]